MSYLAPLLGMLALALAVAPGAAQTIDGSVCFKAHDSAPRATYTVVFGGQRCRLKSPARMACLTERNAPITPTPPANSTIDAPPAMLCYRARCRPGSTRPTVLADAFGSRGVTVRAGRFLCLPAGGEDTITTTTLPGVTTTTIAQRACGFEDGQCGGGCPSGGQRCSIALEGGCACRSTTCGDADTPSCNGSCPKTDETCVYVLTGCECVDLP